MMKFEKCLKIDVLKSPPGGDEGSGEGDDDSGQGGEGG